MKILFITATRIGDAVLSTGVLNELGRRHSDAEITVACGPLAVSLFAGYPGVVVRSWVKPGIPSHQGYCVSTQGATRNCSLSSFGRCAPMYSLSCGARAISSMKTCLRPPLRGLSIAKLRASPSIRGASR